MKCKRARQLLLSYEEGQLEPGDARKLEDHLSSCAACARELELLRKVVSSLSAPLPDPGENYWESFPSAVFLKLASREKAPSLAERIRGLLFPDLRRLVYVLSGASAIALVVFALVFFPRVGSLRNDLSGGELFFENEDSGIAVYSLSDEELYTLSDELTSTFETAVQGESGEAILNVVEDPSRGIAANLATLTASELFQFEEELDKMGTSTGRSES
jgi:hypothetical protein